MLKILAATNNPDKIHEINAILADLPLAFVSPVSLGLSLDISETGSTYYENALLKALAFQQASGLPVLADDSGLEVAALGGQPGIHSHRFNPKPGATHQDRCEYLLKKLAGIPQPWHAEFHCEVVVLLPGGAEFHAHGTCPGRIVPGYRGENGFGYDPIFEPDGFEHTMAELGDALKNRVSHRARALRALDWPQIMAASAQAL